MKAALGSITQGIMQFTDWLTGDRSDQVVNADSLPESSWCLGWRNPHLHRSTKTD